MADAGLLASDATARADAEIGATCSSSELLEVVKEYDYLARRAEEFAERALWSS